VRAALSFKTLLVDRARGSGLLALVLLFLVVPAILLGIPESLLYPVAFGLAFASTLVIHSARPGARRLRGVPGAGRAHRVLLIESEPAIEQVLGARFRDRGIELQLLAAPADAAALWTAVRRELDLIILDARLPYGVLFDIKSTLKDRVPGVPIVILEKWPGTAPPEVDRVRILETSGSGRVPANIGEALRGVAT
jgi:hypothetical protein